MNRATRGFGTRKARRIMLRDGCMCIYCGDIATQIDHVVPYSKGGVTTTSNGVAICRSCNMKKKNHVKNKWITKGLVWLVRHGEDISWIDKLLYDEDTEE